MAPRVRITKQEIVQAALLLVREQGTEALNARAVAAALGCSTQPVFSNFETMESLQKATVAAVYELYLDFIENEVKSGKYPTYKAFGMAYIRFAAEEKALFRLLFMRDRRGEELAPSVDFERSVQMIAEANGVSREVAALMHLEMWSCVHGIAVMLVTSFLTLDQALIGDMLSDVYQGLRARHVKGDK